MNYSSLRTLASVFKVFGILQIFACVILELVILKIAGDNPYYGSTIIILSMVCVAILTFFAVLFSFAAAQFILLTINVAENTELVNNNVYVIATKVEEWFSNNDK